MDRKRIAELASEAVEEVVAMERVPKKLRKTTKGKEMKPGKKPSLKGSKSVPAWLAAKLGK